MMMTNTESTLWMYVWLAILVFLLRKDIAAEWRAMHPRPPRLPPPAGGHWRIRGRRITTPRETPVAVPGRPPIPPFAASARRPPPPGASPH